MYYQTLKNIVREEELKEQTDFIKADAFHYSTKRYQLESGTPVLAEYSIELSFSVSCEDKTQELSNVIRTYIILTGDENLSEKDLTSFIENNVDVKIKNLRIFNVFKQLTDGLNLKEYKGVSKVIKVYPALTNDQTYIL